MREKSMNMAYLKIVKIAKKNKQKKFREYTLSEHKTDKFVQHL